MINVPERVKKALFEKGWTQKKLCGEINVTETGFKRMAENNTWKLDTLEKMSAALGVPIVYFIGEEEKSTIQDNNLREFLLRLEETIGKLTNELSAKDRQIEKLIDLLGKLEGANWNQLFTPTGNMDVDLSSYKIAALANNVIPSLRDIFLPQSVTK